MSSEATPLVVGWDVGGAHLKACLSRAGTVLDVAQFPCALWQGLDRLDDALRAARTRWPALSDPGSTLHAVTMSGEMVDLFDDREAGVGRIAERLTAALPGSVQLYAGAHGWCTAPQAPTLWQHIASANWLATATHTAAVCREGVLVDIGSTTTDLIAFADGRVLTASRSDHDRLVSGELVYQGVVRTPLCALAQRATFQGRLCNVMNEWFATSADVYRLTGELDDAHDQQPSADGRAKDLHATRQRLARMIGLDARDAPDEDWRAFAHVWRAEQVRGIAASLARVLAAWPAAKPPDSTNGSGLRVVAAGCGAFLAADVVKRVEGRDGARVQAYGCDVARIAPASNPTTDRERAAWAQVCAPSVAVASLLAQELV